MARDGAQSEQDWDVCDEMIANTEPAEGLDLPLHHFAGQFEGTAGRVTLTTMHSAKGREFDASSCTESTPAIFQAAGINKARRRSATRGVRSMSA